jgi:processive rubber oxygenase RoxA-like protein
MVKLKIVALTLLVTAVCTFAMFSKSHNSVGAALATQETKIQGWTMEDRQTFYHTAQGTRFFPYSWLLALEAPGKLTREPFLTEERINRYRWIADTNTLNNPDRLPVGMAKEVAPDGEFVSITCAACHTGQIGFNGRVMRIDGGPSMHSVEGFIVHAYAGLADTYARPLKFRRFAKKVLGENATFREQLKLHGELRKAFFDPPLYAQLQATMRRLYPTEEGFGRLDALGRGGNLMLATGIGDNRNLEVANAPVAYPHLWGTPFFDWVQWNGSITQPLARNIAEALGVDTPVTLKGKTEDLFKSNVNIQNLFLLEETLKKLEPPRWPEDLLGAIDQTKATQGEALYTQHCASCHESKMTPPNEFGKTFIQINLYPLDLIGTDPTAAVNFNKRLAYTGQLSQPPYSLPERLTGTGALQALTTQVAKRKFEELHISPEMQNEMNGFRANVVRAPLAYRARNMDGIWATSPYLHNNSVPNMYQLLLPAAQRDKRFYVGNLQYDPKVLGFDTARSADAFELRTNITGNSNAGHEFRDGQRGKGIIGPLLTEEERWAIIEYLKTR